MRCCGARHVDSTSVSVAEHQIVYRTPDRLWRISANLGGSRFTVERDGMFMGRFTSLPALEAFLAGHGIALADLDED